MDCAADQCCRSVNYRKISTLQNEANCEMFHDIAGHNSFDDMLEKNSAFDYIYMIIPDKVRDLNSKVLWTCPFLYPGLWPKRTENGWVAKKII